MSDDGNDWGQYKASHRMLRALPQVTAEDRALLKQEQIRLHVCLIPIERKSAAVHLAKLRARYPERSIPQVALKMLVSDDLDDIAEYPEQLVEYACKVWRKNADNEWAPKSIGQLMECVKYEFRIMKQELHRVGKLLALPSK